MTLWGKDLVVSPFEANGTNSIEVLAGGMGEGGWDAITSCESDPPAKDANSSSVVHFCTGHVAEHVEFIDEVV